MWPGMVALFKLIFIFFPSFGNRDHKKPLSLSKIYQMHLSALRTSFVLMVSDFSSLGRDNSAKFSGFSAANKSPFPSNFMARSL